MSLCLKDVSIFNHRGNMELWFRPTSKVRREQQPREGGCCVLKHACSRRSSKHFLFPHFFCDFWICAKNCVRYFDLNRWFVKNVAVVCHWTGGERICVCVYVHTGSYKDKNHWILESSAPAVVKNTWK